MDGGRGWKESIKCHICKQSLGQNCFNKGNESRKLSRRWSVGNCVYMCVVQHKRKKKNSIASKIILWSTNCPGHVLIEPWAWRSNTAHINWETNCPHLNEIAKAKHWENLGCNQRGIDVLTVNLYLTPTTIAWTSNESVIFKLNSIEKRRKH